jgi:hypothetical protein
MYENSTVENPTGEITPFFWHNKAYGSSKNYLIIRENNPNEFIPIVMPCDAIYSEDHSIHEFNTTETLTINGEEVYYDSVIDVKAANNDIIIGFGHILLLVDTTEAILNGSKTTFVAGEKIGYVLRDYIGGIDFSIRDAKANHHHNYEWVIYQGEFYEAVSSYFYLTNELRTKMWNYYYTYNHPNIDHVLQSNLCGYLNHNIPGTSWGFWYWGNETEGFKGEAVLALYNLETFADNKTYHHDIVKDIDTGQYRNLSWGYDIGYLSETFDYYGRILFTQIEGNELAGIYNRTGIADFAYGFESDFQYFRFEVIPGSDTDWGLHDQLLFEPFENYSDAVAGFTDDVFTYIRGTSPKRPLEPEGNPLFAEGGVTYFPEFNLSITYSPARAGYLEITELEECSITNQMEKEVLFLNLSLSFQGDYPPQYFDLENFGLYLNYSYLDSIDLEPENIEMYIWDDETNKWTGITTALNSSIQILYMTNPSLKISKTEGGTFIVFGKKKIGKTPFLGNWLFGLSAFIANLGIFILARKKKKNKNL